MHPGRAEYTVEHHASPVTPCPADHEMPPAGHTPTPTAAASRAASARGPPHRHKRIIPTREPPVSNKKGASLRSSPPPAGRIGRNPRQYGHSARAATPGPQHRAAASRRAHGHNHAPPETHYGSAGKYPSDFTSTGFGLTARVKPHRSRCHRKRPLVVYRAGSALRCVRTRQREYRMVRVKYRRTGYTTRRTSRDPPEK